MTERQRVVMSDVHGYSDKLRAVVDAFGQDTHYIIAGDFVDRGPDTKGVIDIMQELPYVTPLLGNHEYVALAALTDGRKDIRDTNWGYSWLHSNPSVRMESKFVESYGQRPMAAHEVEAKVVFRATLAKLGHLALMENAGLYYEDDRLVAVHAGVPEHIAWEFTRQHLDTVEVLRQSHIFGAIPRALNNHEDSLSSYRPYDIAEKYVITGHAHLSLDAQDRLIQYPVGGRVMLASHLSAGDLLYVFDVEDEVVRAF